MKIATAIVLTLILSSLVLAVYLQRGTAPAAQGDSNFIDRGEFVRRDDLDIARIILLRCRAVTTGRIGEGGAPSPGSWALTVLYHEAEKNGADILIPIFNQAQNEAGKIYLLLAMYHLNREKFEGLSRKIGNPGVPFIDGCIVSQTRCSELLRKYSPRETFRSQLLIDPLPPFETILEANGYLGVP